MKQSEKELATYHSQLRDLRSRIDAIHKLVGIVDYQVTRYESEAENMSIDEVIPFDEIKLIQVSLHHIKMVVVSTLDELPWSLKKLADAKRRNKGK